MASLEVQFPNATPADGAWYDLLGASGYNESGGEASTRTVTAFLGAASKVGRRGPQAVNIAVSAYVPTHPAWSLMRDAQDGNHTIRCQLTTKQDIIFPVGTGTAAVKASGDVDFVGAGDLVPDFDTDDDYAAGLVLRVGTADYTIVDLPSGGVKPGWTSKMKVYPAPAADVAAAVFSVVLPSLRRGPFTARVVITDLSSLEAESDLTTALTLQPRAILPKWSIHRS